jgi:hypothetical protein
MPSSRPRPFRRSRPRRCFPFAPLAASILVAAASACAPPATGTLHAPLDPFHLTDLKDFAAYRASSNNPDPDDNDDSARPIAGETIVLADLHGPGMVSHLWLTVAANEYAWPRLLRLRVYYDDSPVPSVDAPVGDFFAVGHGLERDVGSLLVRDSSSGRSRNSYWPMPFARGCKITLTNEGRRRMSNVYYHVDWQSLPALPPQTAYFHARYRQSLPAVAGKPYEILAVKGRGHYAGTVLNVVQNQPGWFGEGDESFFVDGEAKARIVGTGTEDYFNDAWTLRVGHGPYAGVAVADGTGMGSRMSAYRFHVPDPIPFTRSLRLEIEHKGWTYDDSGRVRSAFEERPDLLSSVAFWYQDGIAVDQPELPYGPRRWPHGNARQIEVEDSVADVKTQGGTATVERDVFWSKDLLLFKAGGPGASIEVPFDVPEDGRYELLAQLAHSTDYGSYSVQVDGKPAWDEKDLEHEPGSNTGSADRLDTYHTELYVAEDHLLTWKQLAKGRHTVTFTCTGKHPDSTGYSLGLDTLILSRIGAPEPDNAAAVALRSSRDAAALGRALATEKQAEARAAAAWSLGQMGEQAAGALKEITGALSDPDAVVRGLAALALRNLGPSARPAEAALIASLKDQETAVRMMAASALGAQKAAGAIDALIEACKARGEHVHVKRSLANALGEMGPEAARALPVLKELYEIPRVRWAAARAMRKIGGAPR